MSYVSRCESYVDQPFGTGERVDEVRLREVLRDAIEDVDAPAARVLLPAGNPFVPCANNAIERGSGTESPDGR